MIDEPSQIGPDGIKYDFQDGCRILLPKGDWYVQISDLDTDTLLFQDQSSGGLITSAKKYYVRFGFKIFRGDTLIFEHELSLATRTIFVDMHLGGIGDHLAWMGHVETFATLHGCTIVCLVRSELTSLFLDQHPSIKVTSDNSFSERHYYARYKVLIFFNDTNRDYQQTDYRQVGLCVSAAYILGLSPVERRPKISIGAGGRPIEERYVCIGTQATGHNKYWNNPWGWRDIISFLRKKGFRVICIDRNRVEGQGTIWHHMPYNAEDMTGDISLVERARWLFHADFFIGLSSGLSWLAWATNTDTVVISGFTEPYNEFQTPYRVINRNVCTGCANDTALTFERGNYLWCPRHADTTRAFECSKMISSKQVERVVTELLSAKRVPAIHG